MKKKTLIVLIPFAILLITSGILCFVCYGKTEDVVNFLVGEKSSAITSLVSNQDDINDKLTQISKEKKYTFKDAYVELNPYKISPLSAIIIFQTKSVDEVEVYINDKFFTKMEATKQHIIPIYGLYENYDNVVKLVSNGEEVSYTITTEEANIEYPLNVEVASDALNDEDLYFTTASLSTYFTGWDKEGKLRFYLTTDNRMDVEWLSNGHFLIGTTEDQTREQFVGFVEMDYLGKIYNYYTTQKGYSFEFQVLDNGNYMLAGGDQAIYMDHQVVWEMNPSDGSEVSSLDIYDVVKSIDPDFLDKWLGADAIRNGFYYNETTKELIVSFREINALFSFNYETKTLNYVFTDPTNPVFSSEVWKNYFVKIQGKNARYPLGQHSPQILDNGNIAFFNNGYDRYSMALGVASTKVTDYASSYSSLEIYNITNKVAKLVWSYDDNKSMLSIKYGLFRVLDNGNKLADFGYILDSDYRSNSENSIKDAEGQVDGNHSMIIEMDANNNILFKATSDEGKFRVFKHSLYSDTTVNMCVGKANIFNTVNEENIEESDYSKIDIEHASKWIYTSDFTKNTFSTNYEIQESDDIKLYFVNKTGKIYIINYKDAASTKKKRIFNANLNNGDYAFYINLNGNIYKTGKVIKF